MIALIRFSIRHPRWIVGLAGLLTLLAGFAIPRVRLRLDARALIPHGEPAMRASDEAVRRFGVRDLVVIAVDGGDGGIFRPAQLSVLKALSDELPRIRGIVPESVTSLATVPQLYLEGDNLDLRPRLDRGVPPDAAMAVALRRETHLLGSDDGILVSRDGRAAAIYAEVDPAADRGKVGERLRRLVERHRVPGVTLSLSGTVMAQAVLGETAARDLVRLVPLVALVLVGVLSLIFGHPVPALASLIEVGVSLLWTLGVMGMRGESMFVTTLILPVVLIVIGVTDDVYALNRFCIESRRHPEQPVAETVLTAFSFVAPAVRMTAAATIGGLLSLAAVRLEPQRVFGVYGALSVFFSTLFTYTLLPALLVLIAPRLRRGDSLFIRRAESALRLLLARLARGGARWVLAALAILAAPALWLAVTRLSIQDSWIDNLPAASDTVRGDRAINRLLAGTNTLDLLFDGGRDDAFLEPRLFHALGTIEDGLRGNPRVGAVAGAYGDIVRVCAALADADYRTFREELSRGSRRLSRADIEQAATLLASAARVPGMQRLDATARRARVTLFLRGANYTRVREVLDAVARAARGALGPARAPVPFGDGWIGYVTIHSLVEGQIRSIVLTLTFDLLLALVLFRSALAAFAAVLPVAVCVVLVLAALAVLGIPLGTANSMFVSIALGIGIDYGIHLVTQYRVNQRRMPGTLEPLARAFVMTGPSIITSAIAIVSGFAVLRASDVPPNQALGTLVCVAMALCAVMTLLLAPSVLLARRGDA
jgi:predicted RND superfamily exporter protein